MSIRHIPCKAPNICSLFWSSPWFSFFKLYTDGLSKENHGHVVREFLGIGMVSFLDDFVKVLVIRTMQSYQQLLWVSNLLRDGLCFGLKVILLVLFLVSVRMITCLARI